MSRKRLPPGWTEARLPDVVEINPPNPEVPPDDDTPVSFVPMAAVQVMAGGMNASETRPWRDVRKGYKRFQDGDVLFAKITPCMENGKLAVAKGLQNGVGAGSTEFHVLRPSAAMRPDLLAYYLLRGDFRAAARSKMKGTAGQLRVPQQFLEAQTLPVPPLRDQKRIVETIDSHFERLDDVTATLERVRRNLKRYRASILKAAVEGRLVPTEAELARVEGRDYEPACVMLERIVAERRERWEESELAKMKAAGKTPKSDKWKARYKEPVAPDSGLLPPLPEGWCWATSDQLFWFVTSGSRGWAKYYSGSGAMFLRIGNLDRDSIALELATVQHVRVPEGAERERTQVLPSDILISITADVGMIGLATKQLGEAYINQHVALARAVKCIHVPYVAWFLASDQGGQRQFAALRRGATKTGLGLDDIRSISVPLPPLIEQQRIVGAIERYSSSVANCDGESDRILLRLRRCRQAILTAALQGPSPSVGY